jgi:peptide-methionine (S)-S-oxide reductase
VTFDEEIVPEEVILGLFFTGHDPTSLNRQGNDVGTQYRSAMFYRDDEEKEQFRQILRSVEEQIGRPVVTTLEPLGTFWEAEPVHQDFYSNFPTNGYCRFIVEPKLATARAHFHEWVS